MICISLRYLEYFTYTMATISITVPGELARPRGNPQQTVIPGQRKPDELLYPALQSAGYRFRNQTNRVLMELYDHNSRYLIPEEKSLPR